MKMLYSPLANLILLPLTMALGSHAAFSQTQHADAAFQQRATLFTYPQGADLGVKVVGSETRSDVIIRDIAFVGVAGKNPVKAHLVVPAGTGPFAGVLWVHWLGEEKSDRRQFLDEAIALAPKGAVSLLVNAMWANPGWYDNRAPEQDYASSIQQVIELRRAMDLLLAQPNIDKTRIGFVGHDYGAMYGAIAAGVDPRAKTYVFIAAAPSLYNWAFFATQPKSKVDYVRQNAVFELTDYLARLKGSSGLYQQGKADVFISRMDAAVFFRAVGAESKERKQYDSGHDMKDPLIMADREIWLVKELGLVK